MSAIYKVTFIAGFLSLGVGLALELHDSTYYWPQVFYIGFVIFAITQLSLHLRQIYYLKHLPLLYRILLFWILLCFAMISGYFLTLLCWIRGVPDVSGLKWDTTRP